MILSYKLDIESANVRKQSRFITSKNAARDIEIYYFVHILNQWNCLPRRQKWILIGEKIQACIKLKLKIFFFFSSEQNSIFFAIVMFGHKVLQATSIHCHVVLALPAGSKNRVTCHIYFKQNTIIFEEFNNSYLQGDTTECRVMRVLAPYPSP